MEERRTNKHGLRLLALSVRKEKFCHFSDILWLLRACTRTKFPPSYQERWLILSRWLTWLLDLQVPTLRFSSRLSLTVAFLWQSLSPLCLLLWDLAFPRDLPVSWEISCVSPLCGFCAKTYKGILWLALTHTHRTNAHHRATYWTNPGSNIPQSSCCTATDLPSLKPSKIRRTGHAGHCWRSKDKLISNVRRWTHSYRHASIGRPTRTYLQQLWKDTGCSLEDLLEAMDNRDEWVRETVREMRASSTIWWWYVFRGTHRALRWNYMKFPMLSSSE